MKNYSLFIILICISLLGCKKDDEPVKESIEKTSTRSFNMGFTSWSYGPNLEDVNNTYSFIGNNSDIYVEHIDNKIPWNAWINDWTLPTDFTNEINGKVNRRIINKDLLLSISLLNLSKDNLAEDIDGTTPSYTNFNDIVIENAYFKHVNYLIEKFDPTYLVIVIEANELLKNSEDKWDGYKALIKNVKLRVKEAYPSLKISESISLHNVYEASETYIDEIISHMNKMDFVAISFYPFFKNQHTKEDFQKTFDFLHENINKPIAFVETSHIAENLVVPNLNLSISSNEEEQNDYLETLLENADKNNYMFIVWWAHRDFDSLWETFPEDVKDLGQLWRDTGLLDEDGNERLSFSTWKSYLNSK